jgi:AAA15 family ATPase/GTPase
MLTKIEISNFKNFNQNFIFDLSKTSSFEFNQECIRNGIVNKALIYGHNGVGKSNLGLAIFDLVSSLTDKSSKPEKYNNYLNANNDSNVAKFKFEFKFDDNIVIYKYTKKDFQNITSEKLTINSTEFASMLDTDERIFKTSAKGAETLNKNLKDNNISILKYIKANAVLENNIENACFYTFMNFVDKMLFFKTLDEIYYMGFEQKSFYVEEDIIDHNNLDDFESFLNSAGIKCKLAVKDDGDRKRIDFVFKNKKIPFSNIASSGTKSLKFFYFWYQRLKENNSISFLFLDEFDAFYHHSLSKIIIERLKEVSNTQVILTTHNTSIISNDLLRPDCYFLMYEDGIKSLSSSTAKELREAHNIEKMYRAGSFEK